MGRFLIENSLLIFVSAFLNITNPGLVFIGDYISLAFAYIFVLMTVIFTSILFIAMYR